MSRLAPYFYLKLSIILVVQLSSITGQHSYLQYNNLNRENGLSQNTVTCIAQDPFGFLWFGTRDGLNVYNGYDFTVFKHQSADPHSISSNDIQCLFRDSNGTMWIGTKERGLNRYDSYTGRFNHYLRTRGEKTSLSDNQIFCIDEDKNGSIWVGTWNGLNRIDPETGSISQYFYHSEDAHSIGDSRVKDILIDSQNRCWLSTPKNGVSLYRFVNDSFSRFSIPFANTEVCDMFEDHNGKIWFLTEEGIAVFDENSEKIIAVQQTAVIGFEHFIQDQDGRFWVISSKEGLARLDMEKGAKQAFVRSDARQDGLSSNNLLSIYGSQDGSLWIGSSGNGVYRINIKQSFENFIPFNPICESNDPGITAICSITSDQILVGTSQGLDIVGLSNTRRPMSPFESSIVTRLCGIPILSIEQDGNGGIWVGTENSGLFYIEISKRKITQFEESTYPNSLSGNSIFDMAMDGKGNMWFATSRGLSSIAIDRANGGKFTTYFSDPHYEMFEDKNVFTSVSPHPANDGSILAGTENAGVIRFFPKSGKLTYFKYVDGLDNTISSNQINSISIDKSGMGWIGTSNGLNKWNPIDASIVRFTEKNGLPDNIVYGVQEDDNNTVWVLTSSGIARLELISNSITSFTSGDGLNSSSFNPRAICKDESGSIFFGGGSGLHKINPDEVFLKSLTKPVLITKIYTNNQNQNMSPPALLAIDPSSNLQFSHLDKTFTFEFVSLYYQNPGKVLYAYMLEGFDEKWVIVPGYGHRTTFTHLPPGEYRFNVKASIDGYNWYEPPTKVRFHIKPAPWKSKSAYVLYGILLTGLLAFIRRYEIRRITLKNDLNNERFETAKLQELDRVKSQFFENISHEFRTPLTLIKGRLESIHSSLTASQRSHLKKQFDTSLSNTNKLEKLINELLDLSKLESGTLKIEKSIIDFRKLVERTLDVFTHHWESKNIVLVKDFENVPLLVYVDTKKMVQVLDNLLSNAIDFTPHGGTIRISQEATATSVVCRIEDSGEGIPEDSIDRIFDRFFQADTTLVRSHEGSGIGLALVKDLVEIHGGSISVENVQEGGARFILMLPRAQVTNKRNEIDKEIPDDSRLKRLPVDSTDYKPTVETIIASKPNLLIVEDNREMVELIFDTLKNDYQVHTAQNGLVGLEKARKLHPDLIISDIMMPEMDGIAMIKEIRKDSELIATPIILLTARADRSNKIEGLKFRADAYLVKPFDQEELKTQISNLLDLRAIIKKQFASQSVIPLDTIQNYDQDFIRKVQESVSKNIVNASFKVEELAKTLFMSDRQLERKIKEITGMTPNNFIKKVRLQHAKELLQKGIVTTVTEAAQKVGYSQTKYFTKLFKDEYGDSPAKFIR